MKLLETLSPDAYEATSDFYYDLIEGGYIKPEHFVDADSAKKLNEAIQLIKEFENLTYCNVIEEM